MSFRRLKGLIKATQMIALASCLCKPSVQLHDNFVFTDKPNDRSFLTLIVSRNEKLFPSTTRSVNAPVIKCLRQTFHYAIYKPFLMRRHISCIQVGGECLFTCNEVFRHIKSFRYSPLSYSRRERKLNYFTTESAAPPCHRHSFVRLPFFHSV